MSQDVMRTLGWEELSWVGPLLEETGRGKEEGGARNTQHYSVEIWEGSTLQILYLAQQSKMWQGREDTEFTLALQGSPTVELNVHLKPTVSLVVVASTPPPPRQIWVFSIHR
uniref:Uncharacterized protein n=1 Tax=Podarcis muralis TaxID=64176 RepID=A0A670JLL7_PODMU